MIALLIARVLARPAVTDWLIRRAVRTPFTHIVGPSGEMYMGRYWLFNAFPESSSSGRRWRFPISIRLHHIMRADEDRHQHDHPWNARTFILRGWYREERLKVDGLHLYARAPGDTATLKFGEFHRITEVSEGGVWTLFVCGKYRGTWGFLVEGVKVPWRKYLGIK